MKYNLSIQEVMVKDLARKFPGRIVQISEHWRQDEDEFIHEYEIWVEGITADCYDNFALLVSAFSKMIKVPHRILIVRHENRK